MCRRELRKSGISGNALAIGEIKKKNFWLIFNPGKQHNIKKKKQIYNQIKLTWPYLRNSKFLL